MTLPRDLGLGTFFDHATILALQLPGQYFTLPQLRDNLFRLPAFVYQAAAPFSLT